MSVKVMSYVWDRAPEDASAGDMLVALTLADHADRDGGSAFPSLAEIAHATRLSERQVRRVLRRLESLGLIAVQKSSTRRLPTMYHFPGFRGDVHVPPVSHEGGHLRQSGGTFATVRGDICDTHIYKELEPSEEPSENRQNKAPSRGQYTPAFEQFWTTYPRTNGSKRTAFGQWSRLSKADQAAATAGLEKWVRSEHWRAGYVVYAERFLARRMWEDEPAPKVHASPNGTRPEDRRPAIPPVEQVLARTKPQVYQEQEW